MHSATVLNEARDHATTQSLRVRVIPLFCVPTVAGLGALQRLIRTRAERSAHTKLLMDTEKSGRAVKVRRRCLGIPARRLNLFGTSEEAVYLPRPLHRSYMLMRYSKVPERGGDH